MGDGGGRKRRWPGTDGRVQHGYRRMDGYRLRDGGRRDGARVLPDIAARRETLTSQVVHRRCDLRVPRVACAKPGSNFLDRPEQQHVMAKRQSEEPDGREDQPHSDRSEMDLEKDRHESTDVAAATDGRARFEGRGDLEDQAGNHDQDQREAHGGPDLVGNGAARRHEKIDDRQPQQEHP